MFDVLALGAANTDFFFYVNKLPNPDEEVAASSLDKGLGGSAANFAVGCSKLNLKTRFFGCIGIDKEGNDLMQEFSKAGVDASLVKRIDSRTGRFIALIDKGGNKLMAAFPGSSNLLDESMVEKELLKSTGLVHITSLSSETAFKALLKAKQMAKENGKLVSIDPGYILAEKGLSGLRDLLEGIDFLFPSKLGLEKLTGKKTVKEGCKKLAPLVKTIAVTLGKEGCFVCSGSKSFQVKPPKAKVVNSVGAGDAFAAGFIYGQLRGKPVEECAALANIAACFSLKGKGARASQPSEETLLKQFR